MDPRDNLSSCRDLMSIYRFTLTIRATLTSSRESAGPVTPAYLFLNFMNHVGNWSYSSLITHTQRRPEHVAFAAVFDGFSVSSPESIPRMESNTRGSPHSLGIRVIVLKEFQY